MFCQVQIMPLNFGLPISTVGIMLTKELHNDIVLKSELIDWYKHTIFSLLIVLLLGQSGGNCCLEINRQQSTNVSKKFLSCIQLSSSGRF